MMHEHVFDVKGARCQRPQPPFRSYTRGVKLISTGRLNDAAARYGEHAPMAATCCNACRTCVQTNLIALAVGLGMAAVAWATRLVGRDKPA